MELKDGWRVLSAAKEDDLPKDFAATAFADSAWQKVDDLAKFKLPITEGVLAYRYHFNVPAEWKDKPVNLFGIMRNEMDGEKDVFVNGTAAPAEVGGPNGGDVSKLLTCGAENVLTVRAKLDKKHKGGKPAGPVYLARMDAETSVPFTLDPKVNVFDPKYKHATVKWVYPEGRTDPKTIEVGKPVNLGMKAFDVLVMELKLGE